MCQIDLILSYFSEKFIDKNISVLFLSSKNLYTEWQTN